ncbi:MAG: MFS transporter [Chloroflexi bacterium]|nr:MFS transporter [Chloroflexota bacterium]
MTTETLSREALGRFETEVATYYRRNFTAGLVHGVFFQASAAFVDTYTVLPAFVGMLTPSKMAVGLVAAIAGLGSILPELFTAYLVEGKARKKPYLLGVITVRWISWAVLAVLTYRYALTRPDLVLMVFFGLLLLFSLAGGMGTVVYADIFARAIPTERRGRFVGTRNLLGYALAVGAGAVVRTILQDDLRFPFPMNYATLFGLSGVALAIAFTGFALIREPIYPARHQAISLRDLLRRSAGLVKASANFRTLLITNGLLMTGLALAPFYIVYARQELQVAPGLIGVFLSAQMIGAAASNLLWGWLGDRHGNRLVIVAVSILGSAAPIIALAIPSTVASLYAIVFLLLGATLSGMRVGYGNIILEMAPPEVRPTCVALRDTLLMPIALLPLAAGALIQQLPYIWVFGAGALLMGISFLVSLRLLDPRHSTDGMCQP